jgi:hypothetical protein
MNGDATTLPEISVSWEAPYEVTRVNPQHNLRPSLAQPSKPTSFVRSARSEIAFLQLCKRSQFFLLPSCHNAVLVR